MLGTLSVRQSAANVVYIKPQEESIRQYLIRSVLETGYLKNESGITENLLYVLRGIYLKKYYKKINSLYIYTKRFNDYRKGIYNRNIIESN